MRKIEEKMLDAFNNNRSWKSGNTQVISTTDDWGGSVTSVFLFGNLIARKNLNGEIKYSTAGHVTATTCSRLRALGCNVRIKNGYPIRDGITWYTDFIRQICPW